MAGNTLRVLIFGAHPDDADFTAGGTAALYARQGHDVLCVSVTNGDAGHQTEAGAYLARRRRAEAEAAGKVVGARYITLDNHDGELMPTLENRKTIIRLIRQFKPDLIMSPRPNDYHPDHRYTAQLIQDAAYMVTVPNVCSDTPHLEVNPVIVYVGDNFERPYPFTPDVVVAIDDVIDLKWNMLHAHTSQMYEWLPYNQGNLHEVPADDAARLAWLCNRLDGRMRQQADRFRDKLVELYGADKGRKVVYAEAFEGGEHGGRLTPANMHRLFPFFT